MLAVHPVSWTHIGLAFHPGRFWTNIALRTSSWTPRTLAGQQRSCAHLLTLAPRLRLFTISTIGFCSHALLFWFRLFNAQFRSRVWFAGSYTLLVSLLDSLGPSPGSCSSFSSPPFRSLNSFVFCGRCSRLSQFSTPPPLLVRCL